ncbi:MAG: Na+/H+ antiporter subunit E [Bryobacteraceae bacterium]
MRRLLFKIEAFFDLLFYFLKELTLATVRVAADVVRPLDQLHPAVVAVPLDVRSDAEILLLSNLLTLTPGTLSLDVSTDRRVLYIHAMNAQDLDKLRTEIKAGFERRIRNLLS